MSFEAPFMGEITHRVDAAVTSWWLSGGISAADCVAAYQPKGAASYAASKVNLANPGTYDATDGVAVPWDDVNGWKFGGSQWLDSNQVHNGGGSMFVRYESGVTVSYYTFFVAHYRGATTRHELSYINGNILYSNGGLKTGSSPISAAVLGVAGQYGYLNGVVDTDEMAAFTGTATKSLIIGARRREDTSSIDGHVTANILALARYSVVITADQITALTDAMNLL